MCDDSFKYSPTYRRDVPLVGYTGFFPKGKQEDHELDSSISKKMIRGYTGNLILSLYIKFVIIILVYS